MTNTAATATEIRRAALQRLISFATQTGNTTARNAYVAELAELSRTERSDNRRNLVVAAAAVAGFITLIVVCLMGSHTHTSSAPVQPVANVEQIAAPAADCDVDVPVKYKACPTAIDTTDPAFDYTAAAKATRTSHSHKVSRSAKGSVTVSDSTTEGATTTTVSKRTDAKGSVTETVTTTVR